MKTNPHSELTVNRDNSLLTLTLNRAESCNALSRHLLQDLYRQLTTAGADDALRAIILTGKGKHFCSGLDFNELIPTEQDNTLNEELVSLLNNIFDMMTQIPQPIIAAVNGSAAAGGAALLSCCDLVVASDFARIGYPGVKTGRAASVVIPPLVRRVGLARAKYLLLTGQLIPSQQALQWGLVDEVVSTADVLTRARRLAGEIAQSPSTAMKLIKRWLEDYPHVSPDNLILFSRHFYVEKPRTKPDGPDKKT